MLARIWVQRIALLTSMLALAWMCAETTIGP